MIKNKEDVQEHKRSHLLVGQQEKVERKGRVQGESIGEEYM